MKHALLPAALLALAVAAGPVSSAVLTLDCRIQSTKPGYSRKGIRRLVIDLGAKTVQVSDNTGRGFAVRGVRPLISVNSGPLRARKQRRQDGLRRSPERTILLPQRRGKTGHRRPLRARVKDAEAVLELDDVSRKRLNQARYL